MNLFVTKIGVVGRIRTEKKEETDQRKLATRTARVCDQPRLAPSLPQLTVHTSTESASLESRRNCNREIVRADLKA